MRNTRLRFAGSQGHALSAQLDMPDEQPRAFALFAHCFTCSKNYKAMAHISRGLVEAGLGVLRFDFTGLGESGGEFAATDLSSNVGDLLAASRFLAAEHAAPKLLLGHSLGGAAVLRAAPQLATCRAVVTVAAPSHPQYLAKLLAGHHGQADSAGETLIEVGNRLYRIRRQFLEDLARHPLAESLADLQAAVLFLHSPADRVVGIEHAETLFAAARHPKSFVALDGADHLLTDPADGRYAGAVAAAWALRYMDTAT